MAENFKRCKADGHSEVKRTDQYEDFSKHDETIEISFKCSSTICEVFWSLSAKYSSARYHAIVKLFIGNREIDQHKKDMRTKSHAFQTVPGREYLVEVRVIHTIDGQIVLRQMKPFKAGKSCVLLF
jgi:hypothetical protein